MKNIDNVNLTVASKIGIDKNIVKKINSLYWKKIRHRLSNLEDTTISVKGLFNFTISRYLISKKIIIVIRRIQGLKKSTKFKPETWNRMNEGYYDYLRKLLRQRNEVAKLIYEQDNRISKTNTERTTEFSENNRGNNQQCEDEVSHVD